MWEPVGPLPAGVYWRRRCVAIASTLGTVVVVSWLVAALLTPARPEPVEATLAVATQSAEPSAEPTAEPSVEPSTEPPAAPATGEPRAESPITSFVVPAAPPPAAPASVPAAAPPPPPAAAPPATGRQGFGSTGRTGRATESITESITEATTGPTELLLPDETPRRTGPAATPVALPATGPAPCANSALAVTTEVDPQVNRVVGTAVLRLVVTNVSDRPCLRDLDAARQEIVVWGVDGARLWSSNDCSRAAGVDLRTLVPGQPAAFAVTWVGRTSAPGCRGARTTVPPGTYNVMTRVDDVISPPVPMVRIP